MSETSDSNCSLPEGFARKFISGCHILHYHQVLDAYGHLSFRHPTQLETFIMARQIAPALVSCSEDLIQYRVADASPVDASMTDGYVERYIHSEIYKKYSDVHAVIHSHAESVIPYGISGVPLQACFHMAGFLGVSDMINFPLHGISEQSRLTFNKGMSTPVFDISNMFGPDDKQDMLVRDMRLGKGLADCFADPTQEPQGAHHAVVMMRGHGMTVIAPNIEECVLRAIFTQKNAAIQTTVLVTRSAYQGSSPLPAPRFLNDEEAAASAVMTHWSSGRPWKIWVREVELAGLYDNSA